MLIPNYSLPNFKQIENLFIFLLKADHCAPSPLCIYEDISKLLLQLHVTTSCYNFMLQLNAITFPAFPRDSRPSVYCSVPFRARTEEFCKEICDSASHPSAPPCRGSRPSCIRRTSSSCRSCERQDTCRTSIECQFPGEIVLNEIEFETFKLLNS